MDLVSWGLGSRHRPEWNELRGSKKVYSLCKMTPDWESSAAPFTIRAVRHIPPPLVLQQNSVLQSALKSWKPASCSTESSINSHLWITRRQMLRNTCQKSLKLVHFLGKWKHIKMQYFRQWFEGSSKKGHKPVFFYSASLRAQKWDLSTRRAKKGLMGQEMSAGVPCH